MTEFDLVLVEWVDSHEAHGWTPVEEVAKNKIVIKSVGWLIHDDDDGVIVAPHYGEGIGTIPQQVTGHMYIPYVAIQSFRNLSVTKMARKRKRKR